MERVIPGHGHPAIRLSNSNGALRRINGGSKHDSLKVEDGEGDAGPWQSDCLIQTEHCAG